MIKTVSFAPPRAASGNKAKSAPAKPVSASKPAASGQTPKKTTKDAAKPTPKVVQTPVQPILLDAPLVKATRKRAPKNLAEQYGATTEVRDAPVALEAETPRKRLSRVAREKRRELMKPDESLLERLARANATTFAKPRRAKKPVGWEFRCGRCGTTSHFQTPGALCPCCGAMALRE